MSIVERLASCAGADPGARRRRDSLWLTVAVVALVAAAVEFAYGVAQLGYLSWWGFDLDIYRAAAERVLAGGSWFLDGQLHGAYQIANGDVLYPPVAVLGFLPFLVLPTAVFVAVPVAIVVAFIRRCRPGGIALAVIAVCVMWPTSQMRTISANPVLWMAAFAALALRYRWPGALVLLKPSLLPFALIGVRSRWWWVAAAGLVLLSLPFLADTLRYPSVVLDSRGGGLTYSLPDLPLMAIPIVAWLGRTRRPGQHG